VRAPLHRILHHTQNKGSSSSASQSGTSSVNTMGPPPSDDVKIGKSGLVDGCVLGANAVEIRFDC
jgi:hypothetical protein